MSAVWSWSSPRGSSVGQFVGRRSTFVAQSTRRRASAGRRREARQPPRAPATRAPAKARTTAMATSRRLTGAREVHGDGLQGLAQRRAGRRRLRRCRPAHRGLERGRQARRWPPRRRGPRPRPRRRRPEPRPGLAQHLADDPAAAPAEGFERAELAHAADTADTVSRLATANEAIRAATASHLPSLPASLEALLQRAAHLARPDPRPWSRWPWADAADLALDGADDARARGLDVDLVDLAVVAAERLGELQRDVHVRMDGRWPPRSRGR